MPEVLFPVVSGKITWALRIMAMMRYIFAAVGAAGLTLLGPWFWENVQISFLGPTGETAVLAAIGAIVGGLLGEQLGKSKG